MGSPKKNRAFVPAGNGERLAESSMSAARRPACNTVVLGSRTLRPSRWSDVNNVDVMDHNQHSFPLPAHPGATSLDSRCMLPLSVLLLPRSLLSLSLTLCFVCYYMYHSALALAPNHFHPLSLSHSILAALPIAAKPIALCDESSHSSRPQLRFGRQNTKSYQGDADDYKARSHRAPLPDGEENNFIENIASPAVAARSSLSLGAMLKSGGGLSDVSDIEVEDRAYANFG